MQTKLIAVLGGWQYLITSTPGRGSYRVVRRNMTTDEVEEELGNANSVLDAEALARSVMERHQAERNIRMDAVEQSPIRDSKPGADSLLTPAEVAEMLQVPASWIYSHQDQLPTIRLGRYVRFRRSDIARFLEERAACQ
jgi:excisionase family DNA binding protein